MIYVAKVGILSIIDKKKSGINHINSMKRYATKKGLTRESPLLTPNSYQ